MKKLSFSYKVCYSFSRPVTEHCYALRILPETNAEQQICAAEYTISGGSSAAAAMRNDGDSSAAAAMRNDGDGSSAAMHGDGISSAFPLANDTSGLTAQASVQHPVPGRDGFGNRLLTGRIAEPHDRFWFCVTGTAWTRREKLRKAAPSCEPFYRYPTDLTQPGRNLRALYEANRERIHRTAAENAVMPGAVQCGRTAAGIAMPGNVQCGEIDTAMSGGETLTRAMEWMRLTGETLRYEPGVTGIRTTAEEALSGGAGVCQDYAQVLIALLRLDGIPARYIAGLLTGEGATHAWVEAWCGGWWIGLDPTHGLRLTDDYIEVAQGRDYRDCIMDRGIFRGCALQEQQVYARVSEYEPTQVRPFHIL